MKRILLCCTLGLASAAQAGQPISESMVDCAMLLDLPNRLQPDRRQSEKGAALAFAADRFLEAAEQEAAREGRPDPELYVLGLGGTKAEHWDSRGMLFPLGAEFRDWLQYCRALAKDRGIPLKPE